MDSGLKRFFVSFDQAYPVLPVSVLLQNAPLAHYLGQVLRAKAGERLMLVDERQGGAYFASLLLLEKDKVTVLLEEKIAETMAGLPAVTLAVSLIKEQRWDTLLQKCTELGAVAFQPLMSERTVIRLKEADVAKKLARWQAVVRAAAEQSEGLFVPRVLMPLPVQAFLSQAQPAPGGRRVLLKERGEQRPPLKQVLAGLSAQESITLAIGPEGGWTDAEFLAFEQAGFQSASLGQRVLRSETAAMAALSAIIYECAPPLA